MYYNENGDPTLPVGTYVIQETKAAPGYTLKGELKDASGNVVSTDSAPYITVVDSTGSVRLSGGNEYSGFNEPVPTSIRILKKDGNGNPLAGVQYEIKNSKNQVVLEGTTDANGSALFSNLYPDRYTVTELKTASGTNLLKEPFVVETPTRVTEAQVVQYNIDRSKITYDPADNIYYIFDLTYSVTNDVRFDMPITGANGIWKFGFLGIGIMCAVAIGLGVNEYLKQKRRRYRIRR